MSFEQREKGVVLQKIPYADADEIITVLFETSGVKKLFVRGSRQSKKRFAGRIDHFEELSFRYVDKQHGLAVLHAIDELPGSFRAEALDNLFCYGFLSYVSELIREFFLENIEADAVYDLWQNLAEDIRDKRLDVCLCLGYTLNFLRLAGYDLSSKEEFQPVIRASGGNDKMNLQTVPKMQVLAVFRYPQTVLERSLKTLEFFLMVLP